ncbi:conserved membrane hypothetical protein [Tenacibaculum sp. 190524A02b]|uniref:MFS transporter n=2 Tax=Tenacibaculum vairaonense TaxID=3137860 RepID=A0ABM9PPK8_9FLAO
MSLFHIFFKSKTKEQLLATKSYKIKVKERDTYQLELINLLEKEEITKKEYVIKAKESFKYYKNELLKISKYKKKLAYQHSFRGRANFRVWIYLFGLVTLGLFFSCKSLYHDIVNGSTFKFQLISLAGIVVSFFWLIHLTFLTQKDFSESKYITLIIICAALATAFIYYLMKYYTYKDAIILKLLSFLKRVKNKHYKDMAVRAVYLEETGTPLATEKTTNEAMEEFDKDLVTTIKGL